MQCWRPGFQSYKVDLVLKSFSSETEVMCVTEAPKVNFQDSAKINPTFTQLQHIIGGLSPIKIV